MQQEDGLLNQLVERRRRAERALRRTAESWEWRAEPAFRTSGIVRAAPGQHPVVKGRRTGAYIHLGPVEPEGAEQPAEGQAWNRAA